MVRMGSRFAGMLRVSRFPGDPPVIAGTLVHEIYLLVDWQGVPFVYDNLVRVPTAVQQVLPLIDRK
jgi:hypothetical protein